MRPAIKPKKKVILNLDDVGMLNCINAAALRLLESTPISSASVMAPGPWTPGFVQALRSLERKVDIGVHLCLTSEWPSIRIRPVLGGSVPSLTDKDGYFRVDPVHQSELWSIEEVRREFLAQLSLFEKWGIQPTHLDAHMVFYFWRPDLLDLMVGLARDRDLPVLVYGTKFIERCGQLEGKCPPYGSLENYLFPPGNRAGSYLNLLQAYPEDEVGVLALHPALAHPELEAAMGREGARRVEEFELFMESEIFDRLGFEAIRPSDLKRKMER